jgi:hypothetical protein
MARRGEHAPDLTVSARIQNDFEPCVVSLVSWRDRREARRHNRRHIEPARMHRSAEPVVQLDARHQSMQCCVVSVPFDLNEIRFLELEIRVCNP